MKLPHCLPALAIFGLAHVAAFAQTFVPTYNNYVPTIGGTKVDYQWDVFTDANKPAGVSSSISGTASQWLSGINPIGGSTNIFFSGNPDFGSDTTDFLASGNQGGIYSFFSATHFQINSAVPLTGLQSLIVQLSLAAGENGLPLTAAPTLSVVTAGGTVNLAATYSLLAGTTPAVILGMSTDIDLFNYQWDLSGITGPITSYTVNWQAPMHGIFYGQEVTESTAVHTENVLVPEPSAAVATFGGATLLLMMRRSRRTVAA
ncbi:MAG: PEP-CTERM sorting domain-containing protein [Chthoniobacter sp.]